MHWSKELGTARTASKGGRRSREEVVAAALPGAETDSKSVIEAVLLGAAAEPDGEPRNSYASVGNSDVRPRCECARKE